MTSADTPPAPAGGADPEGRPVQDLSRFRVPAGFRGRSALTVQLWWIVQLTLFAWSPQPFYRWRAFLLRLFGAQVGTGVVIRPSARFTYPWKVTIGDNVWIGDRAQIYSLHPVEIGDNVCVSQDCYLCTGSHDLRAVDFRYDCAPITIADEAWLAAGCFVGPGVSVGRGAVAGARSVVMKALDPMMIYVGHPARVIGPRRTRKSTS